MSGFHKSPPVRLVSFSHEPYGSITSLLALVSSVLLLNLIPQFHSLESEITLDPNSKLQLFFDIQKEHIEPLTDFEFQDALQNLTP